MEHVISSKKPIENVQSSVNNKEEEEKRLISNFKKKLYQLGYATGEVEYMLKKCKSNKEAINVLKSQMDIALKCLNIK